MEDLYGLEFLDSYPVEQRLALGSIFWIVLFSITYGIVRVLAYSKRLPGFTHAAIMTYLGWKDYFHHDYQFTLTGPNTHAQELVIELSLTYLVVDTILDIIRGPEVLYFFHHFLLIISFLFCRFSSLKCGGMAMFVMAGGETSNVFMVPWTTARHLKWGAWEAFFSHPTTISFTLIRCVIAPYIAYQFLVSLWASSDYEFRIQLTYTVTCAVLLLGSWYWVYLLLRGYIKHHVRTKPDHDAKKD